MIEEAGQYTQMRCNRTANAAAAAAGAEAQSTTATTADAALMLQCRFRDPLPLLAALQQLSLWPSRVLILCLMLRCLSRDGSQS